MNAMLPAYNMLTITLFPCPEIVALSRTDLADTLYPIFRHPCLQL